MAAQSEARDASSELGLGTAHAMSNKVNDGVVDVRTLVAMMGGTFLSSGLTPGAGGSSMARVQGLSLQG